MEFQEGQILHIFNQGNNREKIFYTPSNYYFFMSKVKTHFMPFVDILAYCLMPNHFHFLISCKNSACLNSNILKPCSLSGRHYQQMISKGLAILLRSYTRAINIQENRSGSLFRKQTKMKDICSADYSADYFRTCFDYIHENPVEAGLVSNKSAWKHSSFSELYNDTRSRYCNKNLVQHLGLLN